LETRILSLTGEVIRFLLAGVDTSFANALRRAMMAEVPTMAIEDIFFFDNSSLIPDEVLANRVGMVPLTTDLDGYVLPEDCDCGADLGCPKCRAVLTLDVEAKDDVRTVYSGDLESEDTAVKPVSDGIILAKLAPGQAIRFEAYAQLGRGKTHSKWSPVSMCVYQNISEMELENPLPQGCLEDCGDAAEVVGNTLRILDIQRFEACKRCREAIPREAIIGHLKEDEFLFTVESTGALPPERIVKEAVKVLRAKVSELKSKVEQGEVHDEITGFVAPEVEETRLYSVGSGDVDEEEEDEDLGEDFEEDVEE